jgi:hypothetical protein
MFRFIAKVAAKITYRWRQEVEAETNLLHAGLATRLAQEKRELVARITNETDDMDARIKEVSEMEEKGFWLCEDGHEDDCSCALPPSIPIVHTFDCHLKSVNGERQCQDGKPMKYIRRDQMAGQEKYESDKDRGEAEKVVQSKREQAKAEEENAANSEETAKYFRDLAANNRTIADKVRRL